MEMGFLIKDVEIFVVFGIILKQLRYVLNFVLTLFKRTLLV